MTGALTTLLGFALLSGAQQKPEPPDPKAFEGIDPKKVDEAIESGVAFLRRLKEQKGDANTDELVAWTFLHAGVPADDPLLKTVLDRILKAPLERTYNVSLQAMVLEKLDPEAHLRRIYECAQFLADNQCRNGQWSYGAPIAPVTFTPPASPKAKGTRAQRRIPVTRRAGGTTGKAGDNNVDSGDFSNSQYAALGIRACHDAGIVFPKAMIQEAREAWVKGQLASAGRKPGGVATPGGGAAPRGWAYRMGRGGGEGGADGAWGSMTVGGVGAVVLYDHILGTDWKRDPVVLSGMSWLAAHFKVDDNPEFVNASVRWHHYYLYGLERAGSLFGTEKIGGRYWYREGVDHLLAQQERGGSWRDQGVDGSWGASMRDTCFAILFLRRATRPVDVASVDRFNPK